MSDLRGSGARLASLTTELNELVQNLTQSAGSQPVKLARVTISHANVARRLLAETRAVTPLFSCGLFDNGPLTMMLDLYLHACLGKAVSVSSLTIASGVPQTTALRCIQLLTRQGVIERRVDEHDARRVWVTLSEGSLREASRYIEGAADRWGLEVDPRSRPS